MTGILWAINLRRGIWYGLQYALGNEFSSASVMSAASSAFMVVLSGLARCRVARIHDLLSPSICHGSSAGSHKLS